MSGPRVSIVVPCRGHAELLGHGLEALSSQVDPGPFEVIVVDAAADPAVERVAEGFPLVRLVRSADGLSPGAARNLGVEVASGEFLAFTDADCRPEPTWLAAAVAALESGARMVGGPILHTRPFHPVAVADNLQQFAEFPPARPAGAATHFPTCNVALRADDFRAAGGFMADRLGEDLVLSRTMARRWPNGLRFVPDMRVRHMGRTGFRTMLRHNLELGLWRGRLGLRVGSLQLRLGRSMFAIPPFAAWRWFYILRTTCRWHPAGLPRLLVLTPLVLPGLVAWAIGFRRGVLSPADERPAEEGTT